MSLSALRLCIQDLSCSCGNRWTHSRAMLVDVDGGFGGTPTPQQEEMLPVQAVDHLRVQVIHCFRCVKLELPKDWICPAAAPKVLSAEEDLLS